MATEFVDTANTTFREYEVTDGQIQTLRDCIEGSTSAEEAARQLTMHPEASASPVEMKLRLGGLWTLLNDTAVALPSAQPKIISILRAIRKLPKANVPTGEGEGCVDLEDGFYWRELTDWANNWADSFNRYGADFLLEHSPNDQVKAKRKFAWISACAYNARLADTEDDAISSYGACLERATPDISGALEVDKGEEELARLEAAAQVFLYAVPELYKRCDKGLKDGMTKKKDSMWKGDDGFSLERWNFWIERWNALSNSESLSDHTREVAKQAFKSMRFFEGWLRKYEEIERYQQSS